MIEKPRPSPTDYSSLTMKFLVDGPMVELHGVPKPPTEEASLHQLRCLVSTHAIDTLFKLYLISPTTTTDASTPLPPEITPIIDQYHHLFEPPTELPPTLTTDHHIPLIANPNPINIQIREILQQKLSNPMLALSPHQYCWFTRRTRHGVSVSTSAPSMLSQS